MNLRPTTVARLVVAGVALSRLGRAAETRPPIATARPRSPGTISVVVPARDEAERIGPLLRALAESDVAEVIVVDDESVDATAGVAAAFGASVVAGRPVPSGWVGKPWALQQGLEAAAGDWVVALDADTRPDPRLPAALVARAQVDGSDLLTVAGRFDCPTAGTRWLHPAMLTTLVYRFGPPGAGARPPRTMANGQCMVFERERLLALGGFGLVAGELVEDVVLARRLAGRGMSVAFLDATDLLSVRMYESLPDIWRGWGRSIGLPGLAPWWRQLADVGVLVAVLPLPLFRLCTRRADAIDAILIAARIGTLFGTRRAYEHAGVAYWLSPLADAPAVAAVTMSALRRRWSWRGRDVAR